jgi:uncharacterized damage-inducible protein DinB
MNDDFASLFAFDRWANAKMLDACRNLTPEQYATEPVPGWSSVRFTVYHIAVVTDVWLRALADDPNQNFPSEEEVPTPEDAGRLLERAYGTLDSLLPTLTPELLATPRAFSSLDGAYCTLGSLPTLTPDLDRAYRSLGRAYRTRGSLQLPTWVALRHMVNHTTYHRGQVASKLKRFGVQLPETDVVFWALEQVPQPGARE